LPGKFFDPLGPDEPIYGKPYYSEWKTIRSVADPSTEKNIVTGDEIEIRQGRYMYKDDEGCCYVQWFCSKAVAFQRSREVVTVKSREGVVYEEPTYLGAPSLPSPPTGITDLLDVGLKHAEKRFLLEKNANRWTDYIYSRWREFDLVELDVKEDYPCGSPIKMEKCENIGKYVRYGFDVRELIKITNIKVFPEHVESREWTVEH